jgi:hypothetical protein
MNGNGTPFGNVVDLSKLKQREPLQVYPVVNLIGVAARDANEAVAQEKQLNEARVEIAKIMQKFNLCRIDAFLGIS